LGKFNSTKNNVGFTLIELLIVIAVIGILAGGLSVFLNPSLRIKQSRDGVRKSDLSQIRTALEMYRSDKGGYPITANFPACNTAASLNDGGSPVVIYMQRIPCDPKNSSPFTYRYSSAGSAYTLAACLENIADSQGDSANVAPCNGTSSWSYTLRNP
jgi:general secretion pathway protein G